MSEQIYFGLSKYYIETYKYMLSNVLKIKSNTLSILNPPNFLPTFYSDYLKKKKNSPGVGFDKYVIKYRSPYSCQT